MGVPSLNDLAVDGTTQSTNLSDRSLHICTLSVYELICKKSIRLRYIKLHIDRFVMIIRTLS